MTGFNKLINWNDVRYVSKVLLNIASGQGHRFKYLTFCLKFSKELCLLNSYM